MWEGYSETILPGAFDGCDMSNVVALFNHEDDYLLARTINGTGTLTLIIDEKGLAFSFDAPNTTWGNEVLENIKLGNIQGCSFAFTVKEQTLKNDVMQADGSSTTIREIVKIGKLYDVGPVVWPAYSETEVEAYKRSVNDEINASNPKPITRNQQLLTIKINKK
jgi:HK97 family phage prohead protease